MIICLTCNRTFKEYNYQFLFWSSDLVECCPYCHTNIYQGDFKNEDKELEDKK